MAEDIKLDTELATALNSRGDLDRVRGNDYQLQRAALRLFETVQPFRGEQLTTSRRAEMLEDIETAIITDDELPDGATAQIDSQTDEGVVVRVDVSFDTVTTTVPEATILS